LGEYLSISYLERSIKKNRSRIYRALLRYGSSAFSLEILEYCEPSSAVLREQYYLDLLKPAYNILTTAGSLLGFKHSEETIDKIKSKLKGRIFTPEHLEKLAGRILTVEHKAKIKAKMQNRI
jgi:group I intron endonuclease